MSDRGCQKSERGKFLLMRETDVFAQVADGFDNVGLSAVDVQRCGIDGQVAAGFIGKLLDDFDVYGIFVHDFAERAGKRAWRAEAVSFL